MDFLAYLAPVAFVFALSAISQLSSLKKEIQPWSVNLNAL